MNERQRALDLALTQIEKQFGKGSIMKLGEHQAKLTADVISTGALALDIALGVGGCPAGASWRSTAPSLPARRRSDTILFPRRNAAGASRRSSTRSTHLTPNTQATSGWTSTIS